MEMEAHLSILLRQYMETAGFSGTARLAKRVNVVFESPGFLHRGTIANWLNGHIKYVRNWHKLVAVGVVLNLDIAEMNMLLISATLPTIWELWETYGSTEQNFFKHIPASLLSSWVLSDEIPSSGLLPANSRMPLRPNPLFVGRDEPLRTIAQYLKQSNNNMPGKTVVLTGIGGVGKTQLAAEFAHRYGRYFTGGVFWLHFDQPEAILSEVALCGQTDNLGLDLDFETLSLKQQARLVQRAWQKSIPRLLIFDGCEDESLLNQWRPTTGGCRVLVTSRRAQWDMTLNLTTLNLNTLTRIDSIQLLQNFLPEQESAILASLANEVGDLPLALHLAGNYLRKYKYAVSIQEYMSQLSLTPTVAHLSMKGEGSSISPTKHVLDVQKTFALSYQKLDPNEAIDHMALIIIARAAFFAPSEPIPRGLLQAASQYVEESVSNMSFAASLARLDGLGLIRLQTTGSIWVHQLIAEFLQDTITEPTAQTDVVKAITIKAEQLNLSSELTALEELEFHLRYIIDTYPEREDELAACLYHEFGRYLILVGDYQNALVYAKQALTIRQRVFGNQHVETANSLDNVGSILQEMGQYDDAKHYLETALYEYQYLFGDDDLRTADSFANLGNLFLHLSEFVDASYYLQKALIIHENIVGKEHPATANSFNSLGTLFISQAEYEQAEHAYKEALTILENVYGRDHLKVAPIFNNLGTLFYTTKDYDNARECYEYALQICEDKIGQQHPRTAVTYNNLGKLLIKMGIYDEAQQYLEKALAAWEEILETHHPDTGITLNNLGELFQAKDDPDKAKMYYEKSLAIKTAELGLENYSSGYTLRNLGNLFREIGELDSAELYLKQASAIYTKVLGAEHPETIQLRSDLDTVYILLG